MSASPQDELLDVLRDKRFDRLVVKRYGPNCCLIIETGGKARVFTDGRGKRKEYRHTWQICDWLMSHFGITPDSVSVESIRL